MEKAETSSKTKNVFFLWRLWGNWSLALHILKFSEIQLPLVRFRDYPPACVFPAVWCISRGNGPATLSALLRNLLQARWHFKKTALNYVHVATTKLLCVQSKVTFPLWGKSSCLVVSLMGIPCKGFCDQPPHGPLENQEFEQVCSYKL